MSRAHLALVGAKVAATCRDERAVLRLSLLNVENLVQQQELDGISGRERDAMLEWLARLRDVAPPVPVDTHADTGPTVAHPTFEAFCAALVAYGKASEPEDVHDSSARVKALWGDALHLRPNHRATKLWVELSPGVGAVEFYLAPYREKHRDPELMRLAYVACRSLAERKR